MQDAKNAFDIYGADEGALMGKSTRETPKKVNTTKVVPDTTRFFTEVQTLNIGY